ncbi:hypothetical protein GPUN_0658 [Glaciecola punicea ACAM 611]|uniref:Uncharacterized protein n=1 Tax=Glaciecola punicea ACAM 611 TaxID=1121923 RepID=H5T921_9ALTE|nr:hypothetical protein GPUN_0658 [Glaciecola punicea ACAM 611]
MGLSDLFDAFTVFDISRHARLLLLFFCILANKVDLQNL